MKLDKSIVQRRIDLMAAEGIVSLVSFQIPHSNSNSYLFTREDFRSKRSCWRRR